MGKVERIVAMKEAGDKTWEQIGAKVALSGAAARAKYRRAKGDASYRGKNTSHHALAGVKDRTTENVREITARGVVIRTLDQLIRFCEVDLAVWRITRHVVNFWGNKDNPSTQIKAWLERIEPEPIRAVMHPLVIRGGAFRRPKVDPRGYMRVMAFGDQHFGFEKSLRTGHLTPFHDRRALDIALQMVGVLKPDVVVLLGDTLDMADWSDKFERGPRLWWTTQPAALEAAWWLSQLRRAAPGAEVVMIEGNHDERLRRAIVKDLPEAYGLRSVDGMELAPLLSMPRLLALDQLGIEWVGDYPNGKWWLGDRVVFEHGSVLGSSSGATAAKVSDDAQALRVFGHVHRGEMALRTVWGADGSRVVGGFSPGCLCRIDGAVPGVKDQQNWQQGVGVLEIAGGLVSPSMALIERGETVFRDRVYAGRDRVDEVRKATGWDL